MPNKMIIITGLSASGKTTIGKEMAQRLNVPFISRDDIKELMFDDLGWQDREWSKKLGVVSFDLLYYFLEILLKTRATFVVETVFKPEFDNPKFLALKDKYEFDIVQIICHADGEVLFERFKKRSESGERHPGHVDSTNYDEYKNHLLFGHCKPLNVPGKIIGIDTTEFGKVDMEAILEQVNSV